MSDVLNLIAGAWVSGDGTIENRNPSDTRDRIGTYAQASVAQLHEAVEACLDAVYAAQPQVEAVTA